MLVYRIRSIKSIPDIAQLVERLTVDQLVLCSIHSVRKDLIERIRFLNNNYIKFNYYYYYMDKNESLPERCKKFRYLALVTCKSIKEDNCTEIVESLVKQCDEWLKQQKMDEYSLNKK